MSYKNEFQSNNIDLQTILDTVNNLPEASSGTSIDTCTVAFSGRTNEGDAMISLTTINNSVVESVTVDAGINSTISNVVCGSIALVEPPPFGTFIGYEIVIDDTTEEINSEYHHIITIPNKKDGIVNISIDAVG